TRYDKLFLLDNQVGGGGRLGFFFNETLALEVDANIAYPFPKAGGPHTQMRFGSVSLVLNSGGQKNILYLLGGYSRLDMGVNPPYNFALHAVNAGLGDRIFFGSRLALRLEARGYYSPKNNAGSYAFEPTFGGHWLITGKKTALYVAYEQSFFLSDRHTTIVEPDGTIEPGNVAFHDMRRIMVGALAFPAQTRIEPFGGGGFAIMQLLNPAVTCSSCQTLSQFSQLQDEADAAASKAFFW